MSKRSREEDYPEPWSSLLEHTRNEFIRLQTESYKLTDDYVTELTKAYETHYEKVKLQEVVNLKDTLKQMVHDNVVRDIMDEKQRDANNQIKAQPMRPLAYPTITHNPPAQQSLPSVFLTEKK